MRLAARYMKCDRRSLVAFQGIDLEGTRGPSDVELEGFRFSVGRSKKARISVCVRCTPAPHSEQRSTLARLAFVIAWELQTQMHGLRFQKWRAKMVNIRLRSFPK